MTSPIPMFPIFPRERTYSNSTASAQVGIGNIGNIGLFSVKRGKNVALTALSIVEGAGRCRPSNLKQPIGRYARERYAKMSKKVELTTEQIKELRRLARAIKAAAEASDIKKRFKAFVDDNEEALRDGVEIDGLIVGVKITKQLTVEEAA